MISAFGHRHLPKPSQTAGRLFPTLSIYGNFLLSWQRMVKSEPESDDVARRRKKRNVGTFPCSKCQKVFSRSDHLARHYLNHQPKEVYVCNHIISNHKGEKRTCGKTFVRKDLRERHLKRHFLLQDSKKPEDESEIHTHTTLETDQSKTQLPLVGNPGNSTSGDSNSSAFMQPQFPMAHNSPSPVHPVPPYQQAQNEQSQNQPVQNAPTQNLQSTNTSGFNNAPHLPHQLSHQLPHQLSHQLPQVGPQGIPPHNGYYQSPMQNHYAQGSHQITDSQDHTSTKFQAPDFPLANNRTYRPFPNWRPDPFPSYYGMQSPPNNNQEINRGTNGAFPQSQNDILSWLFTDSSPEVSERNHFSRPYAYLESSRPAQSPILPSHREMPPQSLPSDDDVGSSLPYFHNPGPDSLHTLGLQDLNFFSNNDNPLDLALLGPNAENSATHGFERNISMGFNFNTSTGSSNSPSNTNESLTPKTIGESSIPEVDAKSLAERLETHQNKRNIPQYPQIYVDKSIFDRMIAPLPQLSRESIAEVLKLRSDKVAVEDIISFYLYGYWESFNTSFSIIHRVSFDTKSNQPLLILAMVLIGCMYYPGTVDDDDDQEVKMSPEYKLASMIAKPLRYALFQHEDFKSPVKVWILQSLNLLEWCEKNYLSREMHERAHIHHGTTVQLLRRSPFLGGNPTVTNKAAASTSDTGEEETSDGNSDVEEASNADYVLFQKWIESESMKRITFMTFYVDIVDYIKFRHNPQIPFYQLQLLNLPCYEEQLWNSEEVNGSFRKLVKRQKKLLRPNHDMRSMKNGNRIKPGMNFLTAIKAIMRSQNLKNGSHKLPVFIKSILFGGLVSIMHEMQQVELQSKFTMLMANDRLDKGSNQSWKELLTKVFDDWDMGHQSVHEHLFDDLIFQGSLNQCSFPMYHLVQIIGFSDINHYDIAIFGGSPRNMSVDASAKDLKIVQKKLLSIWTKDTKIRSVDELINTKSVIHSYWILWELMLAPLNENGECISNHFAYNWNTGHSSLEMLYVVSIATLVLWCYVFSLNGAESNSFAELEGKILLEELRNYKKLASFAAEDGYHYLYRIQNEFIASLKELGLLEGYVLHSRSRKASSVPLHTVVGKYCELLPSINLKQNISGLCFLVGTKLRKSQWQIIRENAKLIINCGLRSVGKKVVHCPDLFDNEFE